MTDGTFEIMGAKLRYRRAGKSSGAPVLYLRSEESLPGDQAFVEALTQTHDVIIPDHLGFGQSDTPQWFRAMGDMAYCYLDFLDHLRISGVHVVGASMGGWIGAEIAVRNSARLASLSLIAPYGIREKGQTYGDVFLWTPEQNIRNRFSDQQLAGSFLQTENTKEETAALLKDRYATARLGWAPRFHSPELQRWLHRIKAPVLLVWGSDDKIAPPAMAKSWQAGLPLAQLVTIAGCGHLPHMERKDETLAAVTQFIGKIREPRA